MSQIVGSRRGQYQYDNLNSNPTSGSTLGSDLGSDTGSDTSSNADSNYSSGSASGSDLGSNSSQSSGSDTGSNTSSDPGLVQRLVQNSELVERLFQLSCTFWTDLSTSGNSSHFPLIHFSGILGIQRSSLVYYTAYQYTPLLAGLIYIGRLLMLEYALPQYPYKILGWPSRSSSPDQLERLQYIRKRYLCRGGGHPMSHLLELLYRGRMLTKKEGARANVSWSADSQVIQLFLGLPERQYQLNIAQFRVMIWVTIQDCQNLLHKLLFNWKPIVRLEALQDNLVNRQIGWSFLKEPANKLSKSCNQLSQRAWDSADGLRVRQTWSISHIQSYFKLANRLSSLLLVCIHFSGGMPGRTTEIATMRYLNTRKVMRNVFIHHGRLVLITEYHKARTQTNHAFYIVRVLPSLVSQILFQYLVYIRPFIRSLIYQMQTSFSEQKGGVENKVDKGKL
jgi:hypothetical protein